jgi:hypothetical protein
MADLIEAARMRLCEVKTISKNVLCKCGNGHMIGTGIVHLVGNTYEHQHRCVFFDSSRGFDKKGCGLIEWFSDKYPSREEREIPIIQE